MDLSLSPRKDMPIPNFENVTAILREHARIPRKKTITPEMRLHEDLGVTSAKILTLLDAFSKRMRLPFDSEPEDLRIWFTNGLSHERSEEQRHSDTAQEIDFGAPGSAQRLYQVVYQGFMSGENFNEHGSS